MEWSVVIDLYGVLEEIRESSSDNPRHLDRCA